MWFARALLCSRLNCTTRELTGEIEAPLMAERQEMPAQPRDGAVAAWKRLPRPIRWLAIILGLWVAYILVLDWRVASIGREFCRMAKADTLKDAKGYNAVKGMEAIGPMLHEKLRHIAPELKRQCSYAYFWGDMPRPAGRGSTLPFPHPLAGVTHVLWVGSPAEGVSLRMAPGWTDMGYAGYVSGYLK
jgi:hypothetical protein